MHETEWEVMVGEMRGQTGGLALDERGIRLARQWLESYDIVGVEPTPLLVARIRTRDRSGRQAAAGVVGAGLALLLLMARLADAVPANLSPIVAAVGFGVPHSPRMPRHWSMTTCCVPRTLEWR
jgi:hypothetical protein